MPSSLIGCPSIDEPSSPPTPPQNRKKRKRKREEDEDSMSPEEETSASPPAGLIAGREEEERRVSSPPSGSKFLHDHSPLHHESTTVLETEVNAGSKEEKPTSRTEDSWGTSDVEKFDGKIVYNTDGSAYIIEDSEMSEDDADLPRMIGDGCIVDGRGVNLPSQYQVFPQIANAFYVSRNASIYNALYNSSSSTSFQNKTVQDRKSVPEVPIMHSYRVYSVRDNKTGENQDKSEEEKKGKDCSSVPVKPILMCFICKLSFGYAKSFVAHAMGDHNVTLQDNEKDTLALKNMSAIIQCVGKEKEPLVSFLEPLGATTAPSSDRSVNRTPSAHNVPKDSDGNVSSECGEDVSCAPESLVIHGRQSSSPPNAATVQNFHVPETSVSLPQNGSSSNSSSNYLSSNSIRNSNNNMSSINCVMDLTRKSPISNSGNNGRNSISPGASPNSSPMMTPNPLQYPQHPPNFLTGTTIGVCPDHMGGRPSGVECAKCEMILNSSRMSTAGPLAGMHSRNSCKTLKCPKCNWHYKYQETLEIHMKEKHPETETSCMFCIAGQPHPRLARGETYTCGYKPYRCEVCNYSTTTKGNLSIHMQSDKHLNNMQELQNGGVPNNEITHQTPPPPSHKPGMSSPVSTSSHQHHSPIQTQSQKPKPTFRCDVCNYETNVARNLRIHMTSEKHTHNIMVLQQNVKHMQTISAMQQSHQQQLNLEQLLHFHSGLQMPNDKPPQHAEAALADMAYNQALLIQMMTGGQLPPHIPPELAPHMDMGLNPETMEPPPEPADPNPDYLFQCCVCSIFQTDSLEQLSHHISQDRTKIREQEILSVVAGNYICNLCTYKTNLKANFMLHCKTDKHLQKLQHVNHVKEGGIRNEWKLKYVSAPGGVQVRCHACDYYTNSAHKLQLHVAAQRHEASTLLFRHLREISNESDFPHKMYHCVLCDFSSKAKLSLLQHVRTVKHLQMEQIHQLQKRSEGKDLQTDINEVFQIMNGTEGDSENEQDRKDEEMEDDEPPEKQRLLSRQYEEQLEQKEEQDLRNHPSDDTKHMCPFCNFVSNSEMRIQAHIVTQHSQQRRERSQSPRQRTPSPQQRNDFLCPLCQDGFSSKNSLEKHVMQIHSVNSEGLQRLLMLVDQSHWLNTSRPSNNQQSSSESSSASKHEKSMEVDERDDDSFELDENRCQTCMRYFKNLDELCQHQNESGHIDIKQTASGPNYLCWKKGCNQYFPSASSLQVHFREIHSSNNNTISEKHVYKYRCNQCSLAFKTLEKLEQHSQYHMIRDATKCIFCSRNFRTIQSLHKHVETAHSDLSDEEMAIYKQSLLSNPLLLAGISGQLMNNEKMDISSSDIDEDKQEDENSDDGSVQYKEQQFFEDYLNSQSIAEDNYNDPNRKYKCHRCKVAFTRQNYLTSHNKTLLHRKGEKLSYPMEKYLDPNRPYKCDVCKESFTQKNILLVHYNSVSHLHKLKRTIQEQQNNNNTSPQSAAAALAASLGVTTPPNLLINQKSSSTPEDDDKKPFKCNICKVAYSQGSTLDIHMRSVLHQTRASKLQDLAMSGQIDLSKPLIEQPEQSKIQDQHKKMIQDILTGSNTVQKPQTSPANTQNTNPNVMSSPTQTGQQTLTCQRCNALFISQEQLTTHQQLYCLFGSPMNMFPPLSASTMTTQQSLSSPKSPTLSTTPLSSVNSEELTKSLLQSNNKKSSHMYKHLLESFGFDLVMQFNENHQRRQKRESTEIMLAELQQASQEHSEEPMDIQNIKIEQKEEEEEVEKEDEQKKPEEMQLEEKEEIDETKIEIKKEKEEEEEGENNEEGSETLPEVSKSICSNCNKEFSSIWVLKAHYEEVHKDLVPLDFLEKYAQHIKVEIEKKGVPPTSSSPNTSSPNTSTNSVNNTNTSTNTTSTSTEHTPEKDDDDEPQAKIQKTHAERPQTAPSTPAASTTPASTTSESIPQNLSSLAAAMGIPTSSASNMPMSLAQQMNEMQAALNVMAASQLHQQLQFNPMMMGMAGLGMGLPLGLNMPALAAMNLQPPLVPMMMPPPFDPVAMQQAAAAQQPMFSPQGAANTEQPPQMSKQQIIQQQNAVQAAANQAAANQQKRARTRITDDQLKILRAHFDINNSPSEDAINEMASQSGLPPKVIKHWFRNTLFKERQRNKDSPYNFNNPPSTSLNLEEYEKTGEARVTKLNANEETSHSQTQHVTQNAQVHAPSKQSSLNDNIKPAVPASFDKRKQPTPNSSQPSTPTHHQMLAQQKQMEFEQLHMKQQEFQRKQILEFQQQLLQRQQQERQESQQMQQQPFLASPSQPFQGKHVPEVNVKEEIKQEIDSSMAENDNMKYYDNDLQKDMGDKNYPHDIEMSPPSSHMNTDRMNLIQMRHSSSPENLSLNLTSIISSQLGQDSQSSQNNPMLPPKLTPPNFTSPNHPGMPLTPTSRSVSPGRLSNSSADCYNQQGGNSNGSNSSGSSGKRANRTRFTDYQIKVLQEFFENNAYPKDDDLEYLSKLLNLSPRVIVVWFQNARQKARKVYENQPPTEPIQQGNVNNADENNTGRFQRTPGLNYQCKKCLLVFQRYYELIRHQKTHCFKEEDAKRSAQAQAAAAQIAAVLSSEDSNSSTIVDNQQRSVDQMSVMSSNPPTPAPLTPTPSTVYPQSPRPPNTPTPEKETTFQCDHCNLVFNRFDLWREHQLVHIMNPNLFPNYPPDSPFGILQQHAQQQQQQQQQHHQTQQQQNQQSQDLMSPQNNEEINSSNPSSPLPLLTMLQQNNKIKQHEEFDYFSDSNCGDLPKDKRLRTTILPEQLDYLYQKYQIESNPSRKMLETIAKEVNLKKRVVQVWFQNTRARERKGQFRAHSQVINKRCPFCPALFKVKSAFESHLSTKHAEQCSKGEINIDAIPDEELSMDSAPSIASSNEASFKSFNSSMPPVFNNANDMDSLKKYYEESMKRYLSEIQLNGTKELTPEIIAKLKSDTNLPREGTTTPLDLSKPFDGMGGFNEFEDDENDDSLSECSDDEILPNSPKNQINNVQMKILSCLYESYKNPNIIEIEALSREMNINKKIIQIWYENTRIKDSKNNVNAIINECNICNVKYNNKYKIQDHIFTKKHIDNLKIFLDKSPNTQILPEIINNNNNNNQQEIAQLQLLQMASNLGISPQSLAIAVSKLDSKDQSAMTNEDLSIVQQLYGLTSNNMNPTNQQQLLSSNGY